MEFKVKNITVRFLDIRIVFWVFIGILSALSFVAIFAIAVNLLWNWLMPDLFGIKTITYLQAIGLVLLTRFLVGGWHHGHRDRGYSRIHSYFNRKDAPFSRGLYHRRDAFREFWNKEGREAFKSYMENRQDQDETT